MIIYKQTIDESELKRAFEVRTKVFIEEQGISKEEEWDGLDDTAIQFVAKDNDKIVATARVRFPAADYAKIERMAVLKPFRRKGVGKKLLNAIEENLASRHIPQAVLHSQWSVVKFYQSCGYEEIGQPFFEADIKHIKMQKEL